VLLNTSFLTLLSLQVLRVWRPPATDVEEAPERELLYG
jgi:hypothetical protein